MARKITHIDRSKTRYEEMYLTRGLSIRQCAAEMGVGESLVKKDLHKLGIPLRPIGAAKSVAIDKRTAETYQDLYVGKGLSMREVAAELGVSPDVVLKDMTRFCVESREWLVSPEENAKREAHGTMPASPMPELAKKVENRCRTTCKHKGLNTRFFDEIDSETKAYALGLIWTDGTIDSRQWTLRITLQEADREALEIIRAAMGAAPLSVTPPVGKGKVPIVLLRVCSREIVQQLLRIGLRDNKCDLLPGVVAPPTKFLSAFVRGAMDGDGSLCRPDYPTIAFYNQNPHLRAIIAAHWQSVTGSKPPTYWPMIEGNNRPRVCEIGERACKIVKDLYLGEDVHVAFARKKARAEQFQHWLVEKKERVLQKGQPVH